MAGEAAALRQLVATFHDSLAQELRQLDAALDAADASQVQFSLHALKGFVPLFCQPDLAQSLIDLYHDSRSQPLAAIQARYRALGPALHALTHEVEAWLGAL